MGIEQWKGKDSGPTAAITIATHGNEPSGYAPYWYLKRIASHIKPVRGSLLFIVNNLGASEKYFAAENAEEKRNCRFLDVNMNRLPEDILQRSDDTRYEIRRALELYPQFQHIDCALDIHSTSQESDPMLLQIKGNVDHLTEGIPIPVSIDHIADIQIGIPNCSLYGGIGKQIPVFEIESGSHENLAAFQLAIRSTLIFLLNSGVIENDASIQALKEPQMTRRHYRVVDSVIFPDSSYELAGDYPMFTPIRRGEVLAIGDGDPLLSPMDGHAIFAPGSRKPISISEEVFFLTAPVHERDVLSS